MLLLLSALFRLACLVQRGMIGDVSLVLGEILLGTGSLQYWHGHILRKRSIALFRSSKSKSPEGGRTGSLHYRHGHILRERSLVLARIKISKSPEGGFAGVQNGVYTVTREKEDKEALRS